MSLTADQKTEIEQVRQGRPGHRLQRRAGGAPHQRIEELSQHLQSHKKDHHSAAAFLMMVGKRKRLLSYIEKTDYGATRN